MKLMNVRPNFMVFFALLFVFGQLVNLAVAEGQENITGEEIGKQILANAPLSIQSGSDLDKAWYAYTIYCDTLAGVNTSEDKDLVNSLQSSDHAESLKNIFLGMGISSNNSFEIVAGKINLTENESGDHGGDEIVPATSKNDSDAALGDQHQDQFHAAVAVAFVDRLYVFDPLMTAGEKMAGITGAIAASGTVWTSETGAIICWMRVILSSRAKAIHGTIQSKKSKIRSSRDHHLQGCIRQN